MNADLTQRAVEVERRVKLVQLKLDRLDEGFLCERTIDITSRVELSSTNDMASS